jgi:hypothetical protein
LRSSARNRIWMTAGGTSRGLSRNMVFLIVKFQKSRGMWRHH